MFMSISAPLTCVGDHIKVEASHLIMTFFKFRLFNLKHLPRENLFIFFFYKVEFSDL